MSKSLLTIVIVVILVVGVIVGVSLVRRTQVFTPQAADQPTSGSLNIPNPPAEQITPPTAESSSSGAVASSPSPGGFQLEN